MSAPRTLAEAFAEYERVGAACGVDLSTEWPSFYAGALALFRLLEQARTKAELFVLAQELTRVLGETAVADAVQERSWTPQ